MKVVELRNRIKELDKKELGDIIVELYKRVPKSKKEEYNIDEFILEGKKDNKNKVDKISIDELFKEIKYFISCVDKGLYASSNRIISKKERSSWRFKVKRYYKELNNVLVSDSNGNDATELLIELFKILSTGTYYMLFVSYDTFGALGVAQSDYYDMLVKRIFASGYDDDNIRKCIKLLNVSKSSYEIDTDMYNSFIYNLKTIDVREKGISIINDEIISLKEELKKTKDSHRQYYLGEDRNNLVIVILKLYIKLSEVDKGIRYFNKNYCYFNKEVKEYVLLNILYNYELYSYWIKEYESNIGKIDFRNSLVDRYEELIGNINDNK